MSGSAMILVVGLLTLVMLEVAMMSLIITRSLGEEGVLMSYNIEARRATEIALNRLEQNLYTYLLTNGNSNVDAAFAPGCAGSPNTCITNQNLMITNPETGVSTASAITIDAWLDATQRRGYYYHLVGRAQAGPVDLTAHRWVMMNPCNPSSSLTTIVSGRNRPGYQDTAAVDPTTGRVYFGEPDVNPDNLYSWHPSTGLSTILSGVNNPGNNGLVFSPPLGLVFFGTGDSSSARLHAYSPSTGLSTLISNAKDIGDNSAVINTTTGAVYMGEDTSTNGRVFKWSPSTGLMTLITSAIQPGENSIRVNSNTDRVYFAEGNNPGRVYTWHASTGLSTIMRGGVFPGYESMAVDTVNDRVFFGEDSTPGNFYTWQAATGLSTLIVNSAKPGNSGSERAGSFVAGVVTDPNTGRAFWGEEVSSTGKFYTWHASTGLSTLISNGSSPGDSSTAIDTSTGRVYFKSSSRLHTWHSSTGLSTIVYSTSSVAKDSLIVNSASGRIYFGQATDPGNFYTWHASTGLSTIMTSAAGHTGEDSIGLNPAFERVYFGEQVDSGGNFYTWSPSTGLSTIVTGLARPGYESIVPNPVTGGVYFGNYDPGTDLGNFYYWEPPGSCP